MTVILLLANDLFIRHVTRAMTDVYYNFFLLCICLVGILLLKLSRKAYVIASSSLFGILAGLASSVKITGILIGSLFFLGLVIYKYIVYKLNTKEIGWYVAAFFLSAISVIYILNPYFWPSFDEIRVKAIIQELGTLYEEVATGKLKKDNIRERYPQLSNLSHMLEFPVMFPRWNNLTNHQLERRRQRWQGNRFKTFHKDLFIKYSSFSLEGILLCIGIIVYGIKMIRALRNTKIIFWNILFWYFAVNYFFILVFMKIRYERYYLPTVIASKFLVAGMIYEGSMFLYKYFCQLKEKTLPFNDL